MMVCVHQILLCDFGTIGVDVAVSAVDHVPRYDNVSHLAWFVDWAIP